MSKTQGPSLSRRQGLRRLLFATLGSHAGLRALGLAPALALIKPGAALALDPVTLSAGMGIAQTALGFLARRKRGPDMAQVMAQASLDYLRQLSSQVASLQEGVAHIILQLSRLDGTIRRNFDLAALEALQLKLRAIELAYKRLVTDASTYPTYQEWQQSPNFAEDWRALEREVNEAVDLATVSNRTDAITSLLLTSVMHVAIGAHLSMGRNQTEIKIRVQIFLDIFEKASDPATPQSAAAALVQSAASLTEVRARLAGEGVVLPAEGETRRVELARIAVHDYTPATTRVGEKCGFRGGGGGGGRRGGEGGPMENCWPVDIPVPAVSGATSAYQFRADIRQVPILESDAGNGKSFAVLSYQFTGEPVMDSAPAAGATLLQLPANTEPARRSAATGAASGGLAATARKIRIDHLLEEHSMHAAIAALNAVALSEMSEARHNVFRFFGVAL